MKKIFALLCLVLMACSIFAQTATNADGTLKFRGNVAIFIKGDRFIFQDDTYVKQIDDETMRYMENSLRVLAIEKFLNMSFSVVNRDNEASERVKQLIQENKLEDYLDGLSVAAKGQGADYLFLIDITSYGKDNSAAQIEISTRLIKVENNLGYHTFYRSKAIPLNNENGMRKNAKNIIADFSSSLENFLLNIFPEQYFIAAADGKNWFLGAYQPNGKIMPTDKFYAFKFKKENLQIGETSASIQVLQKLATAEKPMSSNGYIQVKSSKSETNLSDVILFRNVPQPIFQGLNQITITFFGLNYDTNTFDGLTKKRINNAVFDAITRHPGLQLIETDHLEEIKKERELQKGEDFIDGHVVEQMKAIGATYLLHLESYERTAARVSLRLSLISVADNRTVKEVEVAASIDDIEAEMYRQICDRIAYPCTVRKIDSKTWEMASAISLKEGDCCVLSSLAAIENPTNGEVSYSRSAVCRAVVKEYRGNKCTLTIDKVENKEGMKLLEENSLNGLVTFRLDGADVQTDTGLQSDVDKQAQSVKKKSSWKDAFKKAGKEMLNNLKVNTR